MNLYFRIILILFRMIIMRRKEKVHYTQETSLSFTCLPLDIDINMHMNNGRYLTLLDLCRIHFMWSVGVLKGVVRRGWKPMVGGVEIQYRKSIKIFKKVEVKTRLICWDEKWFYSKQTFLMDSGIAAEALVKVLFIDNTGQIVDPKRVFSIIDEDLGDISYPPQIVAWNALSAQRDKI